MDTKSIEMRDSDIIESAVVALRELWKKKLLIILVTIAGFLLAFIYLITAGNSVRYQSTASLFSAVYGSYSDTTEGVAVMNRYADLINSSRVCSKAAQTLAGYHISTADLQEMVEDGNIRVSGASNNSTSYGNRINIIVYSESERTAIPIANAMASAFSTEINELLGSNAIQILDGAAECEEYYMINVPLILLVSSGVAFILICGIIFCISFFSPYVWSVEQCEQDQDMVLGLLPYAKER